MADGSIRDSVVPGTTTVAIPANPMCVDDPFVTLNSAHALMELVIALDCDGGASQFEMPASIDVTLSHLRELVRDSIKYAEELSYTHLSP
jgi:hypothetical protein